MADSAAIYYAQTMPGVEEIAWLEIRARFPGARLREFHFARDQNGIVLFEYDGSPADLLALRTTEDIFMQAFAIPRVSRTGQDLLEIREIILKSEAFERMIDQFLRLQKFTSPPTCRVISRQYGRHSYRRRDLENTVLESLARRYPRWTFVEDESQLEIWVNLLGSCLLCGLRLSDRTMRHRYARQIELPASLRPSVAAAMVFLTQPQPEDIFLDPMCGSGTILLERHAAAPYRRLYGGDILPERVRAARRNLDHLPRNGFMVEEWDARQLPLGADTIDKVAVNLPFGKQLGSLSEVRNLYPAFLEEMECVLKPDGLAVLLTSEYELLRESIRQRPKLVILRGYSVAVLGQWGRIYIVKRAT